MYVGGKIDVKRILSGEIKVNEVKYNTAEPKLEFEYSTPREWE